ncbi:hypothetical protein [Streptomyces sp. AB3(2024)]|uniref:hypothetical protein n=1 Tax=Streptomyces sp. AB3(2024) TaxID=3317321 RepID=UPI0035A2697D
MAHPHPPTLAGHPDRGRHHGARHDHGRELQIDGVFGQDTGQVVLEHVKRNPWTTGDFTRATSCAHSVPSHTVVLN